MKKLLLLPILALSLNAATVELGWDWPTTEPPPDFVLVYNSQDANAPLATWMVYSIIEGFVNEIKPPTNASQVITYQVTNQWFTVWHVPGTPNTLVTNRIFGVTNLVLNIDTNPRQFFYAVSSNKWGGVSVPSNVAGTKGRGSRGNLYIGK